MSMPCVMRLWPPQRRTGLPGLHTPESLINPERTVARPLETGAVSWTPGQFSARHVRQNIPESPERLNLELVESRTFDSQTVLLRYQPTAP